MKFQCYTKIPKHVLVRMATASLDFSIRKKSINLQVKDLAQLTNTVRRIQKIKYEKERNKIFDKSIREKTVKAL